MAIALMEDSFLWADGSMGQGCLPWVGLLDSLGLGIIRRTCGAIAFENSSMLASRCVRVHVSVLSVEWGLG